MKTLSSKSYTPVTILNKKVINSLIITSIVFHKSYVLHLSHRNFIT